MKKYLTTRGLKQMSACKEAIVEWEEKFNGKSTIVDAVDWLKKNKYWDWGCWFLPRVMTHSQKIEFAIFAAELVIKNYEKQYPKDKRPRKAIEAAKEYLKRPTSKNKNSANAAYAAANAADYSAANSANAAYADYSAANAAYSAANAAYSAANAAYSAANAAYAADYAAAYAAAYSAANSAAYAADYSAPYSANSAAYAAIEKKCFIFGKKLLSRRI